MPRVYLTKGDAKRDKQLSILFSKAERTLIKEAAQKAGRTDSDWGRLKLLDAAKPRVVQQAT